MAAATHSAAAASAAPSSIRISSARVREIKRPSCASPVVLHSASPVHLLSMGSARLAAGRPATALPPADDLVESVRAMLHRGGSGRAPAAAAGTIESAVRGASRMALAPPRPPSTAPHETGSSLLPLDLAASAEADDAAPLTADSMAPTIAKDQNTSA